MELLGWCGELLGCVCLCVYVCVLLLAHCRKDALLNYTNTVDFSKTYEEKFQQLYNSLKQVEEESEYVEFIRENKK